MDTNMPSGEALCRQFLYGQRYYKKAFGKYTRTFWCVDRVAPGTFVTDERRAGFRIALGTAVSCRSCVVLRDSTSSLRASLLPPHASLLTVFVAGKSSRGLSSTLLCTLRSSGLAKTDLKSSLCVLALPLVLTLPLVLRNPDAELRST